MVGIDRSPGLTRVGGVLWIVGVLTFLGATTAEGLLLPTLGYPYSFLSDTISNLGDPSLYPYPYYLMLNVSVIVLGALVLAGLPAFSEHRPRGPFGAAAQLLLVLAGIGSIGVGIFNEHLDYSLHIAMAGLAFISNGLVLLTVGLASFRDRRWRPWAVPCLAGFGVTAVALVLFTYQTTWLLGHGGWERLTVAAPVVWIVVAAVKLLRDPLGRSSPTPSTSST